MKQQPKIQNSALILVKYYNRMQWYVYRIVNTDRVLNKPTYQDEKSGLQRTLPCYSFALEEMCIYNTNEKCWRTQPTSVLLHYSTYWFNLKPKLSFPPILNTILVKTITSYLYFNSLDCKARCPPNGICFREHLHLEYAAHLGLRGTNL